MKTIQDIIDFNNKKKQASISKPPTAAYQQQIDGFIDYDLIIKDHGKLALKIRNITKNI